MRLYQMQGQQSLRMREASISAANLDLLRALSAATSASILDLLKAFSVAIRSAAISASTLDLLSADQVAILSASISAATLDLLRALSAATSASILDLLRAFSVAISASTRERLRATSVAAREAARSAARRERRRAPSTSMAAATELSGESRTCSRDSRGSSRTLNKFINGQVVLCRNMMQLTQQDFIGEIKLSRCRYTRLFDARHQLVLLANFSSYSSYSPSCGLFLVCTWPDQFATACSSFQSQLQIVNIIPFSKPIKTYFAKPPFESPKLCISNPFRFHLKSNPNKPL